MKINDQVSLQPQPTPVLDQRLELQIPQGAWIDGRRQGGLMGHEVSNVREQRVGFDLGPMRLITLAEDPLLLAEPGLPQLQRRLLDGLTRGYKIPWEVVPQGPPGGLLMAAQEATTGREAMPLMVLWMQHPDGTLLKLNWFVNEAAARQWDLWLAVAVAMAQTVTPGPRTIERQARAVQLDWQGEPVVELDLLPDFVLSADRGHDFVVHRLDELGPPDAFGASLGVYFGLHPASHLHRMTPQPPVQPIEAALLGETITWHQYPVEGCVKMEAIEPIHHAGTLMHAFITGADAGDCQRIGRMVESIRAVGGAG